MNEETAVARKGINTTLALALVTSLFFLWALTSNLLPTLIPHLRKACRLNDFQSAFVDSAYWIAYFVMALPAALLMRRFSYKVGIVAGLVIASIGALLFYPASETRQFGFFLTALFFVASGMTFLETAANPYVAILGDPETSSQRLNFAQAFNGLGAFISAFFLSKMVLSGTEYTDEQINLMSPSELESYLAFEAQRLQGPYVGIAILLLVAAILFVIVRLPAVKEERETSLKINFFVFRHKHFTWGVVAQFFYVGAQVCISSFFISYCRFVADIPELEATNYLGYLLLCFMIGRYVGTYLMTKVKPPVLLATYGGACILLLLYCVLARGIGGVLALLAVEFFMSIMFPTIFALAIKGLGKETKMASSFMVMSIVGGAIIPLFLGYVSRQFNVQLSYIVPLLCFGFVFYYGWTGYKIHAKV